MNLLSKITIMLLIPVLLLSCGDSSNSLNGSVSDFDYWNLSFDSVDIRLYDEGIKIRYLRDVSGSSEDDIVASVMVLREATSITANVDIDLAQFGEVDRFVRVYEDGALVVDDHPFPGIKSGTINFSRLSATQGRPVAGKFYILLTNGYTLRGEFSANLIEQN